MSKLTIQSQSTEVNFKPSLTVCVTKFEFKDLLPRIFNYISQPSSVNELPFSCDAKDHLLTMTPCCHKQSVRVSSCR